MPWSRRVGCPAVARTLPVLACCLILGCGGESLCRVSGKVTFAGQPVHHGKIYLTPDAHKNNTGVPGFADITNGQYDTGAKGAQGTSGGPVVARLEGFDADNKPLFLNYQTAAELPPGGAVTKDFDVPASAAKSVPRDLGPPP